METGMGTVALGPFNAADKAQRTLTCPRCLHKVTAAITEDNGEATFTCPHCGYHGSVTAGESKEGRRMSDSHEVQRLLMEAAHAPTLQESQRLVGEAENLRSALYAQAAAERDVDLSNAIVMDHLRPVAVHEHHTAATDWIGDLATNTDPAGMQHEVLAKAAVWYQKLPGEVKADSDEFTQQAVGIAQRTAGRYGEDAQQATQIFLDHVETLHRREASLAVQATPAGQPTQDVFPTGTQYEGLPQQDTTSERAPAIQALENNNSGSGSDVVSVNDPGLGQADTQVDRQNGDYGTTEVADAGQDKQASRRMADHYPGVDNPREVSRFLRDMDPNEIAAQREDLARNHGEDHPLVRLIDDHNTVRNNLGNAYASRKEALMHHAQCPTCGGHGRVAVRSAPPLPSIEQIVAGLHHGVSGLDQVDQIVDPHDNGPAPTPYPEQVAFPWTMQTGQGPQQQTINEAEGQIAQREQLKGASRQRAAQAAAHQAAQMAYRQVMGGQDDSGWMGDMGQGGVGPGEQDGGNPGGQTNLGTPDPVYGYGGDNGNQPLQPYGQSEANDYTNNPGMNWQPGQPTQMDMGGQVNTTQAPPGGGGPGFPNPPMNNKQSALEGDEQLQRALAFVRHRRAYLEQQAS